ncbi:hypothetical protein VTJ49DRAFT_4140 [Mycothermus thermophilus]|uniref:Uncharacterized protein n=1 Tax=Humicola insolens TaxID=85995 RepID=A0ABR3VM22_HUMIN
MITAALTSPATTPAPTPPPAVANLLGLGGLAGLGAPGNLRRRQYDDCLNAGMQCYSLLDCGEDILYATDVLVAAASCLCGSGSGYLQCYFSDIATGSCASYYGVTYDYDSFMTYFYSLYCGTAPPNVQTDEPEKPEPTAPSVVRIDLTTVDVVTVTTPLPPPVYDGKADYTGSGRLLKGDCASTDFTLVDGGATMLYAGFQGCIRDKPDCCPWDVAQAPLAAPTADGKALGWNFPEPADGAAAILTSCPDDYYSISGGCCPTGYYPFTAALGGVTPCWSSADRTIRPPKLTVEKDGEADKPTSAVVNIVLAMRYPIGDQGGNSGLSTAAIAGIGAGGGVALIAIAGIAFCLWSRSRKKKAEQAAAAAASPTTQQATIPDQSPPQNPQQPVPPFQQLQQQQPPMAQQPPMGPPTGLYPPPGTPGPYDRNSMLSTGGTTPVSPLAPQSTGTSAGHVSSLSSQGDQAHLLHHHNSTNSSGFFAGGAAAAALNPRHSSVSSSGGAVSPNNAAGFPAPIAEADEGRPLSSYPQELQGQPFPQEMYAGYPQQQQQQQPQMQQQQYYYNAPPPQQQQQHQQQYYAQHPQYPPQGAPAYGGYTTTPPPPQQQQQGYPPPGVQEMDGRREAYEMAGDQPQGPPGGQR